MVSFTANMRKICSIDSLLSSIVVSPDSRKVAFPVKSNSWFIPGVKLKVNGLTQTKYEDISGIVFSSDSFHVAHVAALTDKLVVVKDNIIISEPHDDISSSSPIFSPNSLHVAYGARENDHWFAVKDGTTQRSHNGFVPGSMVFSPSSKLAYAYFEGQTFGRVQIGGKLSVMNDGNIVATHNKSAGESVVDKSFTFSSDSRLLAYGAVKNHKFYAVIGEVRGRMHDAINQEIHFSPNSKHSSYVGVDGGISSVYLDWKKEDSYEKIGWFEFSPDSQHYAYQTSSSNVAAVVYDGKRKKRLGDRILDQFHAFSPDSNHFVYGVEDGRDGQFAVLDNVVQRTYFGLAQMKPVFSPDSRHLVYAASTPSNGMMVVVNDSPLPLGADVGFLHGAKFVFDSPDKFHTLVVANKNVHLLNVEIKQ